MNPNIPSIEQLKEIALPPPVSYAPQTWGWWVLLCLLVIAVLLVSARRYWQWRRDRYRREALVRLVVGAGVLAKAPGQTTSMLNGGPSSRASPLPQDPATLGGADWQAFLERHSAQPLPADFSQQLAQLAYAPDTVLLALPSIQRDQLFATCKHWVEHHHVAV
jgi:hypothetical protein